MQIFTSTPDEYVASLPNERQWPIENLRKVIKDNIPPWFEEEMNYGMIGYVVPHSLYPAGYHCEPSLPLPFISIASQKNSINLYHMGIYADESLLTWWQEEYKKLGIGKLDIGKSCIRWKKLDTIPYKLIWDLVSKMSVDEWISLYEKTLKK